jgi:hypothetical protein
LLDPPEQTAPVPVPFGLYRLLKRVQVQDERVRPDHLDCFATMLDAVAIVELDRAEIRKEKDVGRHVPHLERSRSLRLLDAGALRAQAHRDAACLRARRKMPVDRVRGLGSAGHRRNQEREAQRLAEQVDLRVDLL